jgi:NADH pyrophosphatase NudC (nudix superfamily)
MKSLYCSKCKKFVNSWQYANKYNSTKFCTDCGTALEVRYKDDLTINSDNDWVYETLRNAIIKM